VALWRLPRPDFHRLVDTDFQDTLLALRPDDSLTILRDGFVDRLSGFSFLPPYYPSCRALASTLARLSSLNAPAFRWTHLHAGLARRTVTAGLQRF
jgi:hypothetical protein